VNEIKGVTVNFGTNMRRNTILFFLSMLWIL